MNTRDLLNNRDVIVVMLCAATFVALSVSMAWFLTDPH